MSRTRNQVFQYYKERLSVYSNRLNETKKNNRKISLLRIIVFVAFAIAIYIVSAFHWIIFTTAFLFGLSTFILLVIRHSQLHKLQKRLEILVKINQTETNVLSGNTSEKDTGLSFLNPDHPYTYDIDVFGSKSLFQLIDRSATKQGQANVAKCLSNPPLDHQLIKDRQKSIAELVKKPDFRQNFEATGKLNKQDKNDIEGLMSWLNGKDVLFDNFFNRLMLIVNPVIGISILSLIIAGILNYNMFLLFLFIPFAYLSTKLKKINKEYGLLTRKTDFLNKYATLLSLIENEKFDSFLLKDIKSKLSSGEHSASVAIKRLSKITAAFDYRLNLLVGVLLNVFFLWDIAQLIRLERWKNNNAKYVDEWFKKLSLLDELCCFAGFTFNNPESVFPSLSNKPFLINAKNVKHPFIPIELSVGNDIVFNDWKQFYIVTGANMAGKSTYLRTTAINLLLAMTGCSVLADQFSFTPVRLYTGIKTSDSLQEGESYFFAELKRLKTIINELEHGVKLFILLDEILKGTNSADKQKGSKSLIRQLIKLGASGMIATHDLSLGELINFFPEQLINKRFEVEIVDNDLVFDYKLKEGISENLNATFLMKKMGITMD